MSEPDPSPPTLTKAQAERAGRSPRDVALSLAALLIPIVLLLVGYRLFFNGEQPIAVDVTEAYSTARHANAFPVLEPRALPAGWSANLATFTPAGTAGTGGTPGAVGTDEGAQLRVVYHAPGGAGVQLVESGGSADAVLAAELGDSARPGNLLTINGRQWRDYPSAGSSARALVLVESDRVVVVIGDADVDRQRQFAAALE